MRRLAELTYDEVAAACAAGDAVAIVPVGSVEPHGPHLPLDTDTTISETCAARAARELEAKGVATVIAPSVPYGVTEYARGFAGAIARYLVDGAVASRAPGALPWGTLVVNVSGSFMLGLLFALSADRAVLPAEIRGPLLIGFIGAYTTFSTYMLESWRLIESGAIGLALLNVLGSVAVGLIAVFVGLRVGRAL